jgi:hypothetical protein
MLRSTILSLVRGLTRKSPPAGKTPRPRRWQPSLEELESRLVPAVSVSILGGVLTVQCDSGANTVTVDHVVQAGKGFAEINGQSPLFADTSYSSIRINGGAGGTVTNIHSNVKPLTVFGDSANDVVDLGDTSNKVQGIQGTVLVEDENGFSGKVKICDQGDTTARIVTLSTVSRRGDTSLGQVSGLGAANIQWDYHDTSAVYLHLGVGASTVNVLGTGVTTTVCNNAAATINVGNGGRVAGIQGTLILENETTANDTVNINDQNDATTRTVTVSTMSRAPDTSLGTVNGLGAAQIAWDYHDTTAVNLNLGKGATTVDVLGTGVPTNIVNSAAATINVGSTSASVAGSLAGIQGALNLQNLGGSDSLFINDQADTTSQSVFLDTLAGNVGSITGLSATITFSNAEVSQDNLNLGQATSTVGVHGIGTNTTISNSAHANVFVGSFTLSGIQGSLTLENEPAFDTIFIDDSEDVGRTFTMTTVPGVGQEAGHTFGQLTSTAMTGNISWDNNDTNSVTVLDGTGPNVFNIFETGVATFITNSGSALINVGNGSLAGIQGALNVQNVGFGTAKIAIFDFADLTSQFVTLDTIAGTMGSITGLSAPITFNNAGTSHLTLDLGPAISTVSVNATSTNTLISNSSNATVFVGTGTLSAIQGGLTLENGSAQDTIIVDDSEDSAGQTFTMITTPGVGAETGDTIGELSSTAMTGNISWDCANTAGVTLIGGSLGNTFNLRGTGCATTIDGGSGANTFDVFAATNSLATDFVGQLTLHGGANPATSLTLDDSLDPNAETFNFAITQAGTGTLTLGSNPLFNLAFDGMSAFVDVLTNGFSTVNDPSGTVQVDFIH